ncbi:MAG: hypothetical protein IT273_00805, partial [Chitinophagales bacterium]|nr:hypothetical protein [Chitinophagales bacterium]
LMGIAWAAILTMPYTILANTIPPNRMGVYMGVANMLVVIPQMVMMFSISSAYKILGNNPVNVVVLGGIMLIISAFTVFLLQNTEVHEQQKAI